MPSSAALSRIPAYRLHRPSGQAVVTLCGQDRYLGPWKSQASRLAYDRAISEWIANGRHLPTAGLADYTVVALLAAYLEFANQYYQIDGPSCAKN